MTSIDKRVLMLSIIYCIFKDSDSCLHPSMELILILTTKDNVKIERRKVEIFNWYVSRIDFQGLKLNLQ